MSSSGAPSNLLERGRAAYVRREWTEAYDALTRADEADPLDPGDLWRLALAGYLIGREEVFESALERAHQGYREAGDPARAARAAVWLGLHLAEHGELARGTGWFGRAGRLLDDDADCVERGYLLLPVGLRHLAAGENEAAAEVAAKAASCAQRFGDRDLLALTVHLQGRALLRQGRMADGLALLDEAMLGVATDELSPQVTGLVYCSVISACRRVYALDRAHEWTSALAGWCEAQPDMVAFRGQCRVFRSELMRLQGSWLEALEEAGRVGGDGEGADDVVAGAAHYEQGEVHRLRGELGEAESAYRKAARAGREPHPGLALLRLAQGDVDAAAAAIRRALAEKGDPLTRARLLPAHVEILLEAGDREGAEAAARELESAAASYPTRALEAMAAQARGTVALVGDDPAAALGPLRQAWRDWRELGAPHDAARARALLGRACLAVGDEDAGALHLEAARAAFEALGAAPDLDRVDRVLRGAKGGRRAGGSHGLTPRELEVLAAVATGKTNRAIAEQLFISEKTVARHVSNIFGKLGLSSRAEATAFAYEHGLTEPPD